MNRPHLQVPPQLTSLLLDFTVNVLLEKPTDIVDYAVTYFTKLRNENQIKNHDQSAPAANDEDAESDEEMDDEPPPIRKATNQYSRRKSVFAEQYDPEEESDEEEKVCFPKSDVQRARLGEAVSNILLFRSLDKNQMGEVLDAMFERKVKPGERVIQQGESGDYFFVIDSGIYNIFVDTDTEKDKLVGKYDNVGSFGELALLYNQARAATIEAATDGTLWCMDRQTFRRIVLKSTFIKRKEYEKLLESVPMLQTLEEYERLNLCDALSPRTFSNGDCIIKQGDMADGMYIVEEGTVKITIMKETENGRVAEMDITTLQKGSYFGELALVTQKPRAASAYAVGDVRLAFLDVSAFERLLGNCMDLMKRNVDHYKKQVVELFGSEANLSDLR